MNELEELKWYQKLWEETEDDTFLREMFVCEHFFEPWTEGKNVVWDRSRQELLFNAAHINQDDIELILQVTGFRTFKIDVEDGMLKIRFGF